MEVYDYIIGHAPIRPPEARHTEGKPELSQMMREDAKWIREEIVGMTMGQIIEAAADRGFFLSVLYELKPGILWHARFERNEFEPGKTRARQGSYASTAIEALYSAYEEIENPGINDERNMKAVGEKWAKIRALRGLDADPTVERNRDPYALEKLLLKHPGIAMRLEDAVRGLLNSLTGESDEDEWV